MFFITYLRRELRRRMRQAVFIAVGLALGVGLVVTVAAASAGAKKAEASALRGLYGVGTEVTVSGAAEAPPAPGTVPQIGQTMQIGPVGPQICDNGHCVNAAGHTFDELFPPLLAPVSASAVPTVARLHDVAAASGVLALSDQSLTFSPNSGTAGGSALPQLSSSSFTVDGVDAGHSTVGPLAAATISSGHSFTAADADADVAVVDSGYAASSRLSTGAAITIRQVRFTVIGIVRQPQSTSPPDVYIPLARAQAVATRFKDGGSLAGDVNLIYVTAASAADVPAVQHEISARLPGDTVTAEAGLASQVTGSLSGAAKLASALGRWLAVLVLIAAFTVASLLTMAAVARRAAEFGTLKALGWRTRRIVVQVLGEAVAMGFAGAAAGVGVGFAGAAIIATIAPTLSATAPSAVGSMHAPPGSSGPFASHAISVPLSPTVTAGAIVLAVFLAVAGGLLAGSLGSWRIARLRPSAALARVA
jgi:putative ABC transport system permease protein